MKTALIVFAVCATMLLPAVAEAGTVYSDEISFAGALPGGVFTETFESWPAEPAATLYDNQTASAPTSLDFGISPEPDYPVTSNAIWNQIVAEDDTNGAISVFGNFWKLVAGTTTIDFTPDTYDGFGFYYSDLESISLIFAFPNTQESVVITPTPPNPNTTTFFGYITDTPFTSVSITWSQDLIDGVGFDNMMVGSTAPLGPSGIVPLPGAAWLGLVLLGGLGGLRRLRR